MLKLLREFINQTGFAVQDAGRSYSPACTFMKMQTGGGSCGGSYIVILNIFICDMCLADYGAIEAIYLCNVVEKIHQYFRPKMRQMF